MSIAPISNENIKVGYISQIDGYVKNIESEKYPVLIDKNISLENKNVILVDDVLFTGRTVRSAFEALLSFGRPKKIELLVFVDRRFCRELPIQADYVGIEVDTLENEKVFVKFGQAEKSVYLTS